MSKQRIEVRSQIEFDACIKAGNIAIVIGCRVVAWENSSVEAWENSSVEAWENSSVEAWENVFIRLFAALSIKATAYVSIMVHSAAKNIEGGRRMDAFAPKTAAEWCEFYGVEVKNDVAVIYKGVNGQFQSDRGGDYTPGTIPIAADWDGGKRECGGGLHYSPSPSMTREFATNATKWIACPVALSDMRNPVPGDDYQNKIKARGSCAPVWEVDRKGKRITA